MFRLPTNRRARIQLGLVIAFLVFAASAAWTLADYLNQTAKNAALHAAVIANDLEGARALIADGADPNGSIGYTFQHDNDLAFYRPLEHAIDQGHLPMIKLLVESGADLYTRYYYKDQFEKSWHEKTALEWSLRQCNREAARYIVYESGKFDLARESVDLLLLLSAECGDANLADHWIELGANPTTTTLAGDSFGPQSPLNYAVMGGNEDVVRLLLRHGADINLESSSYPRGTPLHVGISYGSIEMIALLLDHGADPNRATRETTPLHSAIESDRSEVVATLLIAGADPTLPDAHGETAIALAERLELPELTQMLANATKQAE